MHYEVDSDIDTHRKYAEVGILRKKPTRRHTAGVMSHWSPTYTGQRFAQLILTRGQKHALT